ncbi:SprT family protein [Geomicrobium sp. JSM 1781026]|uniref:SprT family protein n=1 Tax=Geomicrobium sp. JSM 1781026 TaxID=3344580 RepID=UPI0035BF412D
MENEQLQQWTEQLSMHAFNKPFRHQITFNNRLRTTGGRYMLSTHHIEINPKQLDYFGEEELKRIILHELCHYHLHLEGKGYQHKDRSFKELLAQVGGSRHCQTIPGMHKPLPYKHLYECKSCSRQYKRKRQINTKQYVCGGCRGRLKKIQENR